MSPFFDTGKEPCKDGHEPDVTLCSCGYVREDTAKQILEDRKRTEQNKRRKQWQERKQR